MLSQTFIFMQVHFGNFLNMLFYYSIVFLDICSRKRVNSYLTQDSDELYAILYASAREWYRRHYVFGLSKLCVITAIKDGLRYLTEMWFVFV